MNLALDAAPYLSATEPEEDGFATKDFTLIPSPFLLFALAFSWRCLSRDGSQPGLLFETLPGYLTRNWKGHGCKRLARLWLRRPPAIAQLLLILFRCQTPVTSRDRTTAAREYPEGTAR